LELRFKVHIHLVPPLMLNHLSPMLLRKLQL
jgi:hypothetical protein